MLGFSTYAALLPELRDAWRMSNAEAGIVSGMFFAGYIGTVSLWTSLTDRVDARKVYAPGAGLSAAARAGCGTGSLGTSRTDRVEARKVCAAGAGLSAAASAGFGSIASGFGSALLF